MLFLLFHIANERYALDANRVVEIIPLVAIRRLPQGPRGVAGLFNYHGRPVPAVDLSELLTGHPAAERLSTRIVVINYRDAAGGSHLLGLIAEQATATVRKDPSEFVDPGIHLPDTPYLGPVLVDPNGSVHLLTEGALLPNPVRELLFPSVSSLEP